MARKKRKEPEVAQGGFDFEIPSVTIESPTPNVEPAKPKIFSVSELNREVRSLMEGKFAEVWVAGEISNFKAHPNGHFYFDLKDDKAVLRAVMFRGANGNLAFKMENGMEIISHGRLSVYEARGQYQIIIDYCEPKGVGALQLAFEQLKKRLHAEGLFEAKYKKQIPFLPRKIGVVTAPTGAAIQDILNILHRRFPSVHVLLVPVRVQGSGSAEEIAEAIAALNRQSDIDVMIVGRGGGSIEDLWAFNEEVVARAIFASRIPVISAVGHEIDFTIADFVADKRAPTPSAAAELAVPNREDLAAHAAELKRQLLKAIRLDLESKQQSWQECRQKLKDPTLRFPDFLMRLDDLRSRLQFCWQAGFDKRSQNLKKLFSNLDHLSPLHILAKGYSVVQKEGSAMPVKSAKSLKTGETLKITFHDGRCMAKVV
ncbi:MAG: exodeoxyribonuclease VII large subunit [Deltaproteobacteria bacterium]|nr:exodeoxyribonuclease VII large subunit [Deltaproteobacteria bacterium]